MKFLILALIISTSTYAQKTDKSAYDQTSLFCGSIAPFYLDATVSLSQNFFRLPKNSSSKALTKEVTSFDSELNSLTSRLERVGDIYASDKTHKSILEEFLNKVKAQKSALTTLGPKSKSTVHQKYSEFSGSIGTAFKELFDKTCPNLQLDYNSL
jgi:hypothetical protein